jgi:Zn-dependent membrane protease YugP
MFLFDPIYLLFVAPALLLALWAQFRVKAAYAQASRIPAQNGYTGAQAAAALLNTAGISDVSIQPVEGFMTDHYVPGKRVLRLSPEVYGGRSLAAVGIAAHEAGHAIQDMQHYPLMGIRNGLVPLAGIGSNLSFTLLILGFFLHLAGLIYLAAALYGATVLFQLVNLPVEFDASRRARIALVDGGLISSEEDATVAKVLNAAALTYVAATVSAILTMLYFLFRAGLLGGRR